MKEAQTLRMIREMKKRKVKNYEFAKMHILSYPRRIKDIRERGFTVSMDRIWDSNGKATGVFEYWIPRTKSPVKAAGEYEDMKLSDKLTDKLTRLKGIK